MSRTANDYTAAAKVLHWIMAALIICLLCVGTAMVFLPKGPLRGEIYDIHKQIGVAVLLLAVLRLGWRLVAGAPNLPASMPPREQLIAHAGHLGLYVLMFAMPVTGILLSMAGGHPVHFLGLTLPDLTGKNDLLHEAGEEGHELLAWAVALLVFLHAAAALRHHYVLMDDILRRMLPKQAG